MDFIVNYLMINSDYAPVLIFSFLLLAGLNFPISEDILLIVSGILASTLNPLRSVSFFIWVFLGCYLSDLMVYWWGRILGDNLLYGKKNFLGRGKQKYLSTISKFYAKHGMWTLAVGRFIPFGVRNGLFMTAGIGRMSFLRFLVVDGITCFCSNSFLFLLSYRFAKHSPMLFEYLRICNLIIFSFVLVILFSIVLFFRYKRKTKQVA